MKYLIAIALSLAVLSACTSQDATIESIQVKFSDLSVPEIVVSKVTHLSSRDDAFLGRFYSKTTELKASFANFIRYKDGYLFDIQQQGTDAGNVLLLSDMSGKSVKDTILIIGRGITYGSNKFQAGEDGGVLFLPSFSNTIYKIDEKNVYPFYSFDFGRYWASREEYDKFVDDPSGDPFALLKYLKSKDKICFLRFVDTHDQLVLNFEKQEKRYNWFYNKNTGNQYLVEYEENKAKSLLEYYVIGSEGNEFATLIPAAEYFQLPGLPKLTISDEDDPVLVCYHLK